jgi:ubiquinone/menaquinone biosynthesis C-methylase UbiE
MFYNPEAVKKAYDEIAETEDSFEKCFSLRNEIPRLFIRKYLEASDIVLDAGGGTAINAIMMAQYCKSVTLVDISPKILKLAAINIQEAELTGKINLFEGDISNLKQFEDDQFSFVVCVGGTLSYVLEKGQQAIRELVRVARKDSILIIGCDSKYGFVKWLSSDADQLEAAIEIYEASQYEASAGTYAHLYTVDELTELLKESGCEVLEVASTPTVANTWDQSNFSEENRDKLKELELKLCTVPELLGTGHHLFSVARKV